MAELNGTSKARPGEWTPEEEERLFRDHPLTDDTTCGYGPLRSAFLQKFANKKAFVFLNGIVGCILSATFAYYNGTITTLEKRFKIPSRNIGIIFIAGDLGTVLVSSVVTYYGGSRHRPRWITLGMYMVVGSCLLNALPHLLYGAGEDSLRLTTEYGATVNVNETLQLIEQEQRKALCQPERGVPCDILAGSLAPQAIMFGASLLGGLGNPVYYTLGTSYMDDNIKKSKTPALISISYCLRTLGPAIGYSLASACLGSFIAPSLTPSITTKDPRWLGAWWMGWLIMAGALFVMSTLTGMFPKQLPRAAVRRMLERERLKAQGDEGAGPAAQEPHRTSLADMARTFWRLLRNATLMCNNLAGIFYLVGYTPYWMFMPKYIETQFRQSASVSSLVTGTVGLFFSAMGILVSGLVISKFRPRARYLAAWNVFVGIVTVMGMVTYVFLGCNTGEDTHKTLLPTGEMSTVTECNEACHCDYVTYAPVCTADGRTSFVSACHAGCLSSYVNDNGTRVFSDCSCVPRLGANGSLTGGGGGGEVLPGSCPVDCMRPFITFLAIVCLLKFVGATGRASNFLVSVRCVDEKDKSAAMGVGIILISLFAFLPAPIFFGYLLDSTCLVWGKTCSGTGNCWLYNGETLRYVLNFTCAGFVAVGTLFDAGVWFFVKDLKIFDEEVKPKEVEEVQEKIVLEE